MQLSTSGLLIGQGANGVSRGMERLNHPRADHQPEQKVQHQLLTTLGAHLSKLQLDEVLTAEQSDFSAEKVSSRISDYVAAGLANAAARGASPERLEAMYQAAVSGVQRGFAEAKAILEEMPQYLDNPTVQTLVAETESMTLEKLGALAPGAPADAAIAGVAAAADYRESMRLNLVTQDGDRVEVRFSRHEAYQFAAEGESASFSASQRSGFQLKVIGELDASEIDAIEALLSDVSEVADAFYAGRVDEALELAAEVGMDASELASMDLNLKQSSRIGIAQYESLERQAHPEQGWAQRLQEWLVPLQGVEQKAELLAPESDSLLQLLTQALEVRGNKPDLPPGLSLLLAERLN